MESKYVWLNTIEGTFSNSFYNDNVIKYISEDELKEALTRGYRLIKYECINEQNFEFYNKMKLR